MIVNSKTGCLISGTLIKAAETRQAGSSSVTKLAVRYGWEDPAAINERRTGKIINVDCWHELADIAAGLEKGDAVLVTGDIKTREYNGKTYTSLEADNLYFGAATIMQLTNGLAAAVQQLQQQIEEAGVKLPPSAETPAQASPAASPAIPPFTGAEGEMYPGEKLSDYAPPDAARPQPAAPDPIGEPMIDEDEDLPF